MKSLALVFRREVEERKSVLVAAACASLFPLVTALFVASNAPETREGMALVLAAGFATISAVVLGAVTLDADPSRGSRLAFYLTRPIRSSALFFGKLLAVVALAIGAAALVAAPTWLLDGVPGEPRLWLVSLLVVPLLALAVHVLSVAWRSRSPWLLADVLATAGLVAICGFSLSVLQKAELLPLDGASLSAYQLVDVLVVAVPLYLIVAFAIAGFRQLEAGRLDALASHRTLERWLLGLVGIPVVLFGAWAGAISLVGPSSLHRLNISQSGGSWVALHGSARGRGSASFLLDTASGRSLRLPPYTSPTIAASGSSAAWMLRRPGGTYEMTAWDLTGEPRELALPGVVFPKWPELALSPDGTRLAASDGRTLVVLELASARILGSLNLAMSVPVKDLVFLTGDRVRIVEGEVGEGTTRVSDFEVAARSVKRLFEVPATNRTVVPEFSRDGAVALTSDEPGRLDLRDGHTGALLATLVDERPARARGARLPDGRFVAIVKKTDGTRAVSLRTFSSAGSPELELPIEGTFATFIGMTTTGELALSVVHREEAGKDLRITFSVVAIDLSTGTARTVQQNVRAVASFVRRDALDLETVQLAGIRSSGSAEQLVRIDAATGAATEVPSR